MLILAIPTNTSVVVAIEVMQIKQVRFGKYNQIL